MSDLSADPEAKRATDHLISEQHSIHVECLFSSFGGIILAGGLYPVVVNLVAVLYRVVTMGWVFGPLDMTIIDFFMIAMIACIVGILISFFTGIIAITIVGALNRSIGYPLDPRSSAISAGSLAGFIPTAWILFIPYLVNDIPEAMWLLLLPIVAMCMGGWGAARTTREYDDFKSLFAAAFPKHQLSIKHMMMATAWVAATFALANFFGATEFAVAVGYWIVLQAIMLTVIHFYRKFRNAT